MAGQISQMTDVSAIDRTADKFEVTQGGATKRANVNQMLGGIAGAPVGTTDTQALTNKTLDNTNTITAKAGLFTLQDGTDTSKQAVFSLSGITTATTRTYTLPNASGTLVDLATAQTLTNKTLTSPTLTTPTINNPTLNTDAISEFTVGNGVTVAGMSIKSGKLNTANSVITTSITDAAVTPAKLVAGSGAGWTPISFTPAWTNLTVGNGTNTGAYTQIGKLVKGYILLTLGTTSSVAAGPSFTPPVPASTVYNNGSANFPLSGGGWLNAAGGGYLGFIYFAGSNTVMRVGYAASNVLTQITASLPGVWANTNILYADFEYLAA